MIQLKGQQRVDVRKTGEQSLGMSKVVVSSAGAGKDPDISDEASRGDASPHTHEDAASLPISHASNSTIATLMGHRSIRAFTQERVDPDAITTILEAALHAPTSSFYQQTTIIQVRDPDIREQIHQASGQPYVGGTRGELLIFVADLHRNAQIRREAGEAVDVMGRTTLYVQAFDDTMIAAQNAVVAAESLGLGTVYLGSINGDARLVIRALKLPKLTMPVVGLLIGHPDQSPQLKPRLPLHVTTGVDAYPEVQDWHASLADYDAAVSQYYDLRDSHRRIDSFTKQVANKLGSGRSEQEDLLAVLHEQGLLLR